MGRLSLRLLMVASGLSLFALYGLVAIASYGFLVSVFPDRPDPIRLVVYFSLVTLTVGYLSYRLGTAGLLRDLDGIELTPERAPGLYARLDRIAPAFDVEDVTLYAARMEAPNALAIGTARGGAIVLDVSLFRLLTPSELETIIAHELAHLEGRDGLIQTLGYTAVRTAGGVCYLVLLPIGILVGGLFRALSLLRGRSPRSFLEHLAVVQWRVAQAVVVALFAVTLLLRVHSRRREYAADDRAAEATDNPMALARALVKIQRASTPGWGPLAPLYVYGDEEGLLTRLFATHPPVDERIRRLIRRANEPSVTRRRRRARR